MIPFATALLGALVAAATPAPPACSQVTTPFIGTLCPAPDGAKHAAILLLGGSEGGNSMGPAASAVAARGYVTASVAYFGAPGLPSSLENVPVETVGAALDAIAKRDDVDPNRIAIFGISKGGELALLAASVYPRIHAVVADVGSPFAWQGIAQGPQGSAGSWTLAGKPVPFVPYATAGGRIFAEAFMQHKPLELRPLYDGSMKDKAATERAFFHLENVRGPILLLAGADDKLWNSATLGDLALAYLHAHHHPYADEYVNYPDAGHLFLFSTAERPLLEAPFAGEVTLVFGGTPQGNVGAARQAWTRIYAFLDGLR